MEERREKIILSQSYEKYQNTELWNKVWQAIDDLVENNDIEEQTPRGYIVGAICEKLEQSTVEK